MKNIPDAGPRRPFKIKIVIAVQFCMIHRKHFQIIKTN